MNYQAFAITLYAFVGQLCLWLKYVHYISLCYFALEWITGFVQMCFYKCISSGPHTYALPVKCTGENYLSPPISRCNKFTSNKTAKAWNTLKNTLQPLPRTLVIHTHTHTLHQARAFAAVFPKTSHTDEVFSGFSDSTEWIKTGFFPCGF